MGRIPVSLNINGRVEILEIAPHRTLLEVIREDLQLTGTKCGFSPPGMILSAKALLDRNPSPTEREIRQAISGNLCRCTGYTKIVESVMAASGQGAPSLQKEDVISDYSVVGKRVSRTDSVPKVTGATKFSADLYLPGMLYAKELRRTYAHARH